MESNKGALTQTAKEPTGKSVPAEELPLAERVKLAEAAVPFDAVAPGWLIDAKDTVDNWCVANVVKVDNGELVVNYDGWSPKYDTVHAIWSIIMRSPSR